MRKAAAGRVTGFYAMPAIAERCFQMQCYFL
jgi:hypothetical protein